tara:strand:- start:526 stop:1929 length:1404 start_codon:yes stop_codon:yes gene_type:complete
MAVNDGLTVFNLVDGVVDEFHDESGTDEAEGSNDLYCASNDYYINSTQPTGVPSSTPYSAGFGMSSVTEADTSTNSSANPAYGEVTASSAYTVPSCISSITAHVWGGGGGARSPNAASGHGGYAKGTIAVTAGQSIKVGIAEGGGAGGSYQEGAGGGEGGTSEGPAGSGGMSYVGTTDINALSQPQYGPNQPTVFVVGGGGATATCAGAAHAGGLTGHVENNTGAQTNNTPRGGGGGDQEQGGQGGTGADGTGCGQTGAAFKGGRASPQRGTGGGAGYFGGGGGSGSAHTNQTGGGGSSYYGHPQVTGGATVTRGNAALDSDPVGGPLYPATCEAGEGGPPSAAAPDGYVFITASLAISASATSTTVISNAFTSSSVPTVSRIVVFEENVATPTLNTDIIASISRDGGSTFTTATLSDSGYVTGSSGQRILSGQATISGQPSGQSMRWKLALANNSVKIHGVALQWS